MLKFGIETETVHLWFQNKRLDIFGFIEKAAEFGYDGVVLNIIEKKNQMEGLGAIGRDDPSHLAKVREALQAHNLFVEIDTRGTGYEHLIHVLDLAETLGAERVRTFVLGGTSYNHSDLGGAYNKEDFRSGIEDLKRIVPELERRRIFLAVENHELETSLDMNWLIQEINSPWVGILYDPGNFMMAWEDPVDAARRCAPYIFGTHMKNNVVCLENGKPVITGTGLAEGSIDLKEVCRVLLRDTQIQRMNIEMCYPYTSTFKRSAGTGGSSEFTGAFAIRPAPLPMEEVLPSDYYLYDGRLLEELLALQMDNMKNAVTYFRDLCNTISSEKA